MTEECKDLISNLLIKEPENRIGSDGGIDQILQHPWFSDIDVNKLLNKELPPPFIPTVKSDK